MKNYYKQSLNEFKKTVRKNKEITIEEWDKYAQEKRLFSANTLRFHTNLEKFGELKKLYS